MNERMNERMNNLQRARRLKLFRFRFNVQAHAVAYLKNKKMMERSSTN